MRCAELRLGFINVEALNAPLTRKHSADGHCHYARRTTHSLIHTRAINQDKFQAALETHKDGRNVTEYTVEYYQINLTVCGLGFTMVS